MDQKKIGCFLKKLRNEKQLTQEQLANRLYVSQRTISRWETGSNIPDISMLLFLADFYDVDLREIIDGERKNENMNEETKETLLKVVEYTEKEKDAKKNKLNRNFIIGGVCLLLVILNHQFGVLSIIFNHPIDDFVAGVMTSIGIFFEIAGLYDNNHEISLRRKKHELFVNHMKK
ncbi:helix-turn-helix domain-containing protein [Facklamia sp. P12945]|uniref:helix-turn-helix domain-containing protein n=1 Tax=unclassified Facklamia TaxID=2622293 RepID=UPI003D16E237